MNEALQSYTPTERPLEYDSLVAREGCEATSGNDLLGWRAYERICVFAHDTTAPLFNQPDTVSYSLGPAVQGSGDTPFNAYWAAWVGGTGIRIARIGSVVPPANSIGSLSGLYPSAQTNKVAHSFNGAGLLAIAIQKTTSQIELKRYTSTNTGTGGDVVTFAFTGVSPVMFNTSLLDSSIETKSGNVVLYLRPERPTVLFGRFERDTTPFGVERVLMPDLRIAPARLLNVFPEGRKQVLRYIDRDGRDVTATSPVYAVDAGATRNKVSLATSLTGGLIYQIGVPADAGNEKANITIAFAGGLVYDAIQLPDAPNNPLPFDATTFSVALEGGEVEASN